MAVSRALRRLLRVLEIEEEQSRLALESAVGELGILEHSLTATRTRERSGRRLVISSAQSGELPDRLAGLEETRAARRRADALAPRIADAEVEVTTSREVFLAKRVERRQAETLIHEIEAQDAVIAGRRSQQALDDWYLNRLQGTKNTQNYAKPACSSDLPDETHRAANKT
jgi:antitoxin component of MazEF toxin-antitoxin module